ncbi:MAG: ThuA domain-containing protein [Verrucomicrobiales bacterium]|nr:ThuA domain-containing protein [Verrucomicrobiales bacterium]
MKTTLSTLTALALAGLTALTAADGPGLHFSGKEGPGKGKKIVFICGDEEYRSEEALPMLAKILSQRHGFDATVLFPIDLEKGFINPNEQKNIPGTEALAEADLLVIFTRFRDLPADQTAPITAFLNAGKPVIGLRTSTHAFAGKMEDGGWTYGDWQKGGFGMKILGETWVAHHGVHKKEGARGVIEEANASHPVLRGVKDVFAPSDVYTVKNLTGSETVLMRGIVTETLDPASKAVEGEKNQPTQALAWLREYTAPNGTTKGQAFCTTAGASVDLVSEDLRRLVVNAALHLTGVEVPEKADVAYVDPFYPSFFGFIKDPAFWLGRNLKPEDFALGKAPVAVDPAGSPEWPFREMGPKP